MSRCTPWIVGPAPTLRREQRIPIALEVPKYARAADRVWPRSACAAMGLVQMIAGAPTINRFINPDARRIFNSRQPARRRRQLPRAWSKSSEGAYSPEEAKPQRCSLPDCSGYDRTSPPSYPNGRSSPTDSTACALPAQANARFRRAPEAATTTCSRFPPRLPHPRLVTRSNPDLFTANRP